MNLELFPLKEGINLLPKEGEAYFYRDVFSQQESEMFFERLRAEMAWEQTPIVIYGKEILQPRLTAWYGDPGTDYSYSDIQLTPLPWTTSLLEIKSAVEKLAGVSFNSALLNQYRDQNDSMGWHRDNEKKLGTNPVIASVSFGAVRQFRFRHYHETSLKTSIDLTSGSVLLMKGSTQHHWQHAIFKEKNFLEPRINITFRTIQKKY